MLCGLLIPPSAHPQHIRHRHYNMHQRPLSRPNVSHSGPVTRLSATHTTTFFSTATYQHTFSHLHPLLPPLIPQLPPHNLLFSRGIPTKEV